MAGADHLDRARRQRALVLLLLALVLATGAGLRFHRLDAQSLWTDEIASWQQSHQATLGEVIEKGVRPTPYPPAYPVLIYAVIRYLGDSEVALRLPSAIAGVLAILALFAVGRQLYGPREGLAAAALLAVSYSALYYAQEARAYSLLMLFAIVSSGFWLRVQRALEEGARPATPLLAGYVASAAAAMYLHYFGLLLVAIQMAGLGALYVARPRALAWVAGIGVALLALYAPWLPYLIEEFGSQPVYLPVPTLRSLGDYWRFLFYIPGDWLKWVVAAVFAAALARHTVAQSRAPDRRDLRSWCTSPTVLVAAWLVLPVLFAWLRSQTAPPIFNNRNLIVGLPPALLLLARAITTLLDRPVLQFAAVGLTMAAMIQGIYVTGLYYDFPRKQQFREAAMVVALEEAKYPDARIVARSYARERFDYYLERTGATQRVALLAGSDEDVDRLRDFLEHERPQHLWLLDAQLQFEPGFLARLEPDYVLLDHVQLWHASARLYRRRPDLALHPQPLH